MTAINIVAGQSCDETIRNWFTSRHPEYPQTQLRIWEDHIVPEMCNPYTDVYNVVYFLDPEWNCIRVMGMTLYGQWDKPMEQFPLPFEVKENNQDVPFLLPPIIEGEMTYPCVLDDLKKRVEWICQGGWDYACFPDDPVLEHVSRIVVGMVPWYDNPDWERRRLHVEHQALVGSLKYLCDGHVPELSLLPTHKIEPTRLDLQLYYERYPEDGAPPQHWFEVGMEELSEPVDTMYPGYKTHIHYRQLPNWYWCRYQRAHRRIQTQVALSKQPLLPMLEELKDYIVEESVKEYKKRQKTEPKPVALKHDEVGDIEDLLPIAPPCIQHLCTMKRFPQCEERKFLVSVLRKGGIAVEVLEQILDNLNEAYPRESGHQKLVTRFDYLTYYDKGYGAPGCEKMRDYCPFIGKEDQRKVQCRKHFQTLHPTKCKDYQKFYGPASWFYWTK